MDPTSIRLPPDMTPFAQRLPSARNTLAGPLPTVSGQHLFLRRNPSRHPTEPPQATRSSRVRIGSSGIIRASFMPPSFDLASLSTPHNEVAG